IVNKGTSPADPDGEGRDCNQRTIGAGAVYVNVFDYDMDPVLRIGATIDAGGAGGVFTAQRLAGVEVEAFINGVSAFTTTTTFTGVQGTVYEEFGSAPEGSVVIMCVTTPTGYHLTDIIVNKGTIVADPDGEGRFCNQRTIGAGAVYVNVFDYTDGAELRIGATIEAGSAAGVFASQRLAGVEVEAFVNGVSAGSTTTTLTGVQGTLYEAFGTAPTGATVIMCVTTPAGYSFSDTIVNKGTSPADPDGEGRDCNQRTIGAGAVYVNVFDYDENPILRVGATIEAGGAGGVFTAQRLAGVQVEAFINGVSAFTTTTTLTGVQGTTYETFGDAPEGSTVIMCVTTPVGYSFSDTIVNKGTSPADPDGEGRDCNQRTIGAGAVYVNVFDFDALPPTFCNGLVVTHDLNRLGVNAITGTAGDDVFLGTPANDTIVGAGGNDTICGEGGNDVLWGISGINTIFGGPGDDIILGGTGLDTIFGEAGNDQLWGFDGNDVMHGGDDNDIMQGMDGDDTMTGGSGVNTFVGNDGNDTMTGGPDVDVIWGLAGNDMMFGGAGNDVLLGNEGNDTGDGGPGIDWVLGHDGIDVLTGGDDADLVWGGPGNDTVSGGAGDDFVVVGEEGADTVNGDAGNDTLLGDNVGLPPGDDTLNGGPGNDVLWGFDGNDTLNGNDGDDVLLGGDGAADTCDGGAGTDATDGLCENVANVP
ncbi:MAG: calcium-binding protein, partial [Actinomycetota bacterium]